jgi:hypothetical protein
VDAETIDMAATKRTLARRSGEVNDLLDDEVITTHQRCAHDRRKRPRLKRLRVHPRARDARVDYRSCVTPARARAPHAATA